MPVNFRLRISSGGVWGCELLYIQSFSLLHNSSTESWPTSLAYSMYEWLQTDFSILVKLPVKGIRFPLISQTNSIIITCHSQVDTILLIWNGGSFGKPCRLIQGRVRGYLGVGQTTLISVQYLYIFKIGTVFAQRQDQSSNTLLGLKCSVSYWNHNKGSTSVHCISLNLQVLDGICIGTRQTNHTTARRV